MLLHNHGVRNVSGELQTSVVYYEHRVTGRKVVFIGSIHIADAQYFDQIQRVIDSLSPDHKILFEGVSALSQAEKASLSRKQKKVLRHFRHVFVLIKRIAEMMSLRHQKDGLKYEASWVNTDMRLYDLVKVFSQHDLYLVHKKTGNMDELGADAQGKALTKWFINKMFAHFVLGIVFLNVFSLFSRRKRMTKKMIVQARNQIAIEGVGKYLTDGNVVTIWGVEHFSGINKGLKKLGFREVRREWFTAYKIRDYRLMDAIYG